MQTTVSEPSEKTKASPRARAKAQAAVKAKATVKKAPRKAASKPKLVEVPKHEPMGSQEVITPDIARELLATVADRKLSRSDQQTVESYAADMKSRNWKVNGEAIIIDLNQKLVQGRLRCEACVASDTPFETLVIINISPENARLANIFRRRTPANDLQCKGVERDATHISAAAKMYWKFINGVFSSMSTNPSRRILLNVLHEHPMLQDRNDPQGPVEFGRAFNREGLFSTAQGIFVTYLLLQTEGHDTLNFLTTLATGESDDAYHPALLLRKKLASLGAGRGRIYAALDYTMRAWQAFCDNEVITKLTVKRTGDEWVFPDVAGYKVIKVREPRARRASTKKAAAPFSKGSDRLRFAREMITPDRAREFLSQNTTNRRPSNAMIKLYAKDMEEGRFVLTGDTIKIGKSGRLLDGQHRLYGGVTSDCVFETFVVYDVDDDAFDTFDVGKPTSASMILKKEGRKYWQSLVSATRMLIGIEEGRTNLFNSAMSQTDILEAVEGKYHDLDSSSKVVSAGGVPGVSPSAMMAMHYLCAKKDREAADLFFIKYLQKHSGLVEGEAPYAVVEKLRRAGPSDSNDRTERMAWVIKAWNLWREGKKASSRTIQWRMVGANREPFPQPI